MSMMSLKEILNGKLTDKETIHSYGDVYSNLFENIRNSTKNVLEIGVHRGGSILAWSEYFHNAHITGVDDDPSRPWLSNLQTTFEDDRVEIVEGDAYKVTFMEKLTDKYDIIIDDGPHTLDSMTFCAKYYSNLLTDDGILIIEDVQDYSWVNTIVRSFPSELQKHIQVVDLRHVKNRYDDILIILNKKSRERAR